MNFMVKKAVSLCDLCGKQAVLWMKLDFWILDLGFILTPDS